MFQVLKKIECGCVVNTGEEDAPITKCFCQDSRRQRGRYFSKRRLHVALDFYFTTMTAVNIQRYGELELSSRLGEIDQFSPFQICIQPQ
jgi:hypothetical protein